MPKKPEYVLLQIRVPVPLKKRAQSVAKRNFTSMNAICAEAIKEFVEYAEVARRARA